MLARTDSRRVGAGWGRGELASMVSPLGGWGGGGREERVAFGVRRLYNLNYGSRVGGRPL